MPASEPVVVPISGKKTAQLALVGLVFVGVGAGLLVVPPAELRVREVVAHTMGSLSILLGLAGAAAAAVRARRKGPGLVVDDEGVLDRTSGTAVGPIPWSEVLEIERTTISSQRFVTLRVRDATRYSPRGAFLVRAARAVNPGAAGDAIHISANALAIDFDELERLLLERFDRWSAQHARPPG